MQVITNEKLIRNRARLGRVASFAGLGILILGLVASLSPHELLTSPQWMLASFGCLLVGFLLSQVGIYNANRWVKEPRADQTLEKILKGFDARYHLYNYVLPASHVLLTPFGLCVIKPRQQGGEIRCQGEKCHRELGWKRILRLFGQEGLGNPTKEVRAEVEKLRRFLAQRLPDEEAPIEGVVVFTNPQVDLEIENPAVPVLDGKQFKSLLRNLSKERPIPGSQRKQLAEILAGEAPEL
ncbi:MAG: nuclease-related domain-containing protein [Anaerolineae bacterium]